MATEQETSTHELINSLFDRIKEQEQFTSDSALARHIGVPDMYIWRWRRGEYGASLRILAPLLITYAPLIQPAKITP